MASGAGGHMVLKIQGSEDIIFTGNPTLSFFAPKFKQHTRFGREMVRLDADYAPPNLDDGEPVTVYFKVPRLADGLLDMYLIIPLPDIYSGVYTDASSNRTQYEFQWVPHIGYNIIDSYSLQINGQSVVTRFGEWDKIDLHLSHSIEERTSLARALGHTVDMYNPAWANGRQDQYPTAFREIDGSNCEPSIYGRELWIPLQFGFCKDTYQMLPLARLQYAEVRIKVVLKGLYNWFTIIDPRGTSSTFGKRIRGDPGITPLQMNRFLVQPDTSGDPVNTTTKFSFAPVLQATFVWLENDERMQLRKPPFYALPVRNVNLNAYTDPLYGTKTLQFNASNMVTRLVWVAFRTDRQDANDWDNYTNWEDARLAPVISSGQLATPILSSGRATSITNPRIVTSAQILLMNGAKALMDLKSGEYFEYVMQARHHPGASDIPGICTYSFALDNRGGLQPCGFLNFSKAGEKTWLRVTMQMPPANPDASGATAYVYRNTDADPDTLPNSAVCLPATLSARKNVMVYERDLADTFLFLYGMRLYVESWNFIVFADGTGGLQFAT